MKCRICGKVLYESIDVIWVVDKRYHVKKDYGFMCGDCMDIAEKNGKDNIKQDNKLDDSMQHDAKYGI